MRKPLVLVTGVDETAMDAALLGLAWGAARTVVVRHTIDPFAQVLTRVVSDVDGVLERVRTPLEHACVGCAVREDVLPTLERLAHDGRWEVVVCGLPVGAEADQVATTVSRDPRFARRLRLSRLVAAVSAAEAVDHLLSDVLLREVGRHSGPDDERGLGEVGCAQVEAADVVVLDGDAGDEAHDLLRALARPGADLVVGADRLDPAALATGRHSPAAAHAWTFPTDATPLPPLAAPQAWRLDLVSPRPFHPERLLERIGLLGGGPFRSRGCFWLPTRPGSMLQWAGAGGQLSIGTAGSWGQADPLTRIVVTGLRPAPTDLAGAFETLLVTPGELLDRIGWRVVEDGLEPWLGAVHDAA